MTCEKCGAKVTQTIADNCVSRIKRYKTVAYYCDHCDKIFILDKYKDMLDDNKYNAEYSWLRERNSVLRAQNSKPPGF